MRKFTLPLNLQLFAEDDDMILPDDFVDTPPQENETTVDEQEGTLESFEETEVLEDTTPNTDDAEAEQEPVQTPPKVKIKYNSEERELDLEEAAQLAQKGMNYEKAVERARQEARDAVIAEMGYTWNGKPIQTEAEYKQALEEQRIIEKYKDRDLPEEVIQELIESRRDREERQRKEQEQQKEQERLSAFNEFFEYFEEVNERPFDPKMDTLPQEVQEAVNKGQSLLAAYMKHHNKELRNQLKIAKQNQTNLKKAPVGSVTAGGSKAMESEDPFLQGFNED